MNSHPPTTVQKDRPEARRLRALRELLDSFRAHMTFSVALPPTQKTAQSGSESGVSQGLVLFPAVRNRPKPYFIITPFDQPTLERLCRLLRPGGRLRCG